jgi:hypothetical protein
MGIMKRLLVPRSVRRSYRVARHPARSAARAVTPKPIKRAGYAASSIANPLDAVERAAENAVVDGLRGSSSRRSRSKGRSAADGGSAGILGQPESAQRLDGESVGPAMLRLHPMLGVLMERQTEYRRKAELAQTPSGKLAARIVERGMCDLIAEQCPAVVQAAEGLVNRGLLDGDDFRAWYRPVVDGQIEENLACMGEIKALYGELGNGPADEIADQAFETIEQIKAGGIGDSGGSDEPPRMGKIEMSEDAADLEGLEVATLEALAKVDLTAVPPEFPPGAQVRTLLLVTEAGDGARSLLILRMDDSEGKDGLIGLLEQYRPVGCALIRPEPDGPSTFAALLVSRSGHHESFRIEAGSGEQHGVRKIDGVPGDTDELDALIEGMKRLGGGSVDRGSA